MIDDIISQAPGLCNIFTVIAEPLCHGFFIKKYPDRAHIEIINVC